MLIPDPTFVMFGKLVLAAVLGMLIGTERAVVARQSAGTRTFALVSLGACMFTLVGWYVDNQFLGYVNFDPMRIAAGIVMGVGFIGGGVMFFQGNGVHGITTAAGLWVAASIGVVVGFGMYALAVFATALTLVIFFGMWYVEHRFKEWYHDSVEEE
ncbi:MAG: MgtC/SapB family protein [Patescibacteria group bacterium]